MREIKFRKWDEENKEMIDGDCLAFEEYAPLSELLMQDGIMQYTGLHDKNFKEIYEGDILQYHDYMWNFNADQIHIGVVRWQDWNGAFDCERRIIDGKEVKPEHGLPGIQFKWQAEVIGNIYETPELLEGENG